MRRAEAIYLGIDHYQKNALGDLKAELGLDGTTILYQSRSSDTTPYKEGQSRLERAGAMVLNGVLIPFMPSVYQCADIFATATQWEGFDLPLLEASYFELPVVAFEIGAHPEIVQHGRTGYLARSRTELLDQLKKAR